MKSVPVASSILSRMANDNLAKQLSSSWTWGGGPSTTIDNIFKQMAAQGQSYFQASGDSDAYTGSQTLDTSSQANAPVDSTNITAVGGTTLTMNGSGASWSSETVWNWNSTAVRCQCRLWRRRQHLLQNSLVADGREHDGQSGFDRHAQRARRGADGGQRLCQSTTTAVPATSAAPVAPRRCGPGSPRWSTSKSVASGGTTVGFLNPALYAIGAGTNYSTCFHDITTGNNIGTDTPGLYYAVAGYDLCTGWGTPNGTNLINALAPVLPYFLAQPSSQIVTNGGGVTFSATVGGLPPLGYQWLFNGTNLPAGGNVSGVTSNILSIVGGDDKQLRQLQSRCEQQLRFRDQQHRRPDRRFCARIFRAAVQLDSLVRQQRRLQRGGRRFGAAGLSMAEKWDQHFQRRGNFRRDEQRPDAHRRHHQQRRQLQPRRDQSIWRLHQQRGDPDGCAAAVHHQFIPHQPHHPVRQQQSCLRRHRRRHAAAELSMESRWRAGFKCDQRQFLAGQRPSAESHGRRCRHQSLRRRRQQRRADGSRHHCAGNHAEREQSAFH